MTDVFSKEKRSQVMSAVHSKGNKSTEIALISIFKSYKISGWRRNCQLTGKPDFVFPKHKIIVFVDGCYWHGHGCRKRKPGHNDKYWKEKISKNKKRDSFVTKELRNDRWKVIRIWECEIRKHKYARKINNIMSLL
ncbi:MAG TPA: very short patch repair endonuclease [Anaerolineales bacterium]|nr:DNA mismatch endonuclease Vsr [Anaerolineales bacterium]HNQ95312.1 very short patch repair endonuclease [Anaerolineales bacterium]HNS62420.1 very short patch repair endonuclease [Anaerolineales bacterium]